MNTKGHEWGEELGASIVGVCDPQSFGASDFTRVFALGDRSGRRGGRPSVPIMMGFSRRPKPLRRLRTLREE